MSPDDPQPTDANQAANVIRDKLNRIYANEPDTSQEMAEAEAAPNRSPHQQYMHQLRSSGKSLAEIQTEWHNYYVSLPDDQKHQVWQEFYASQSAVTGQPPAGVIQLPEQILAEHKHQAAATTPVQHQARHPKKRSPQDIQTTIRDKVSAGGKLQTKHHLQSLLFGLGMGGIAVVIFLFSFFNEVIIAPFIQPGRASASTPLILNSDGVAPTSQPEVIIPKINVEIPVNYNETSTNEADIENDLEGGVVHYPTTVKPGEIGNAAFFGHSSNNILNPGKYKFAFVLLHLLVPGDTFYLTYNGKVYVYKVISKNVVDPSDVSVLNPVAGQTATATLITCDPPGTSWHRLVVVGQQISPDPAGNTKSSLQATSSNSTTPTNLPGNGPTLWARYIGSGSGKIVTVIIIGGGLLWLGRYLLRNRPLARTT